MVKLTVKQSDAYSLDARDEEFDAVVAWVCSTMWMIHARKPDSSEDGKESIDA